MFRTTIKLPITLDRAPGPYLYDSDRPCLLTGTSADGARVALPGPLPLDAFKECAVLWAQPLYKSGPNADKPHGAPTPIEGVYSCRDGAVISRRTSCGAVGHHIEHNGRCPFCEHLVVSTLLPDESDPDASIDYGAAARELRVVHDYIRRETGLQQGYDGQWGNVVGYEEPEWSETGSTLDALEQVAEIAEMNVFYTHLPDLEAIGRALDVLDHEGLSDSERLALIAQELGETKVARERRGPEAAVVGVGA